MGFSLPFLLSVLLCPYQRLAYYQEYLDSWEAGVYLFFVQIKQRNEKQPKQLISVQLCSLFFDLFSSFLCKVTLVLWERSPQDLISQRCCTLHKVVFSWNIMSWKSTGFSFSVNLIHFWISYLEETKITKDFLSYGNFWLSS